MTSPYPSRKFQLETPSSSRKSLAISIPQVMISASQNREKEMKLVQLMSLGEKVDAPIKFDVLPNRPKYAKIILHERPSPCTIAFSYKSQADLTVFVSTRHKIPTE